MINSNLTALLSLDNKQEIELINNLDTNFIGPHISAFLNTQGGFIVCEIENKTVDISNIEQLKDEAEIELQKNIQPYVLFSFEISQKTNKLLIVIEVPVGKDKPYSYKNDIFIRESETTVKADINAIRDMVLFKQTEPERWERRSSELVSEDDLSTSELTKLFSAKRVSLEVKNIESDTLQQLQLLSLAKYKRLTNAGDIILSKNPTNRHPQARVRAVAYQEKSDDDYQDFRNFEGPLIEVLENISSFIEQNTPTKVSFSEYSNSRIETPLYPVKAIREGLVNAFAHRDYSSSSGGILVEISKDQVKIWNSGSFPDGINEETLKKGHISILRNPDISHILYIRNYMERLGRGSVVIQETCKRYGLPEPKWTSDINLGVTLTFFAPKDRRNNLNFDEHFDELAFSLNIAPKVLKLILVINGELSRSEIQEKLELRDDDTVSKKYIKPAIDLKYIERTIPDKPTSNKQKYRLTLLGKELKEKHLNCLS